MDQRFIVAPGSVDQTFNIFIRDLASSTGDDGKVGLVFNSAGLVCWRTSTRAADATVVALVTLATPDAAHANGGFKEIDAADMPGWYRFDAPDLFANEGQVSFELRGAAGMRITRFDVQVANVQSAGSGPRVVTTTVDDGTDPVQGASVRYTKGVESYVRTTDVNGVAVFALSDGTWDVYITAAGYDFFASSLVVDGVEAPTFSISATNIVPSAGSFTTGFVTAYDEVGAVEPGITITAKLSGFPEVNSDGTLFIIPTGVSFDSAARPRIASGVGLVSWVNLVKGAMYTFQRGPTGTLHSVTIPQSAGATYALPAIIGQE